MQPETNGAKASVIMIEDNERNVKLVEALLKKGGYEYCSANDAENGIQLIRKNQPDLVLMDIQLPGMDGLSATRILKNDPETQHIPIVALSAHAMQETQTEAREAGVAGFISKPFSIRTFLNDLEQYVPQERTRRVNVSSHTEAVKKNRILVVDDDPKNLKLIKAKLNSEPYEIKGLTSGYDALTVVHEFLPDIILLDIMMPGIDGYEVVNQLKSDERTEAIPVVLITQLDGADDKAKGLQAGADEFLNKPVNTEELKARIRSLLQMKRFKEQLDGRETSTRMYHSATQKENESQLPFVLIAEDDEKDCKIIKRYLQGLTCKTITVNSGQEALTIIEEDRPDIVLLDIMLPDLDGWRICKHIKEDQDTAHIQVIMLTSLHDADSRIRAFEAGTDDYLIKPIHAVEFQVRIRSLLRKKAYLDSLVNKMKVAVRSSITESLTGLYTNGYLKHFLDMEFNRAQRYSQMLAFIMIDIDDFKSYNDTHGHLAGDAALMDFAHLLRDTIRATDLSARYGGEEFAIVLPYSDEKDALMVAEKIKAAIDQFNASLEDGSLQLPTVSMGIASFPSRGIDTSTALITKADEALYSAKHKGKNCCILASTIGTETN